MTGLKKEWFGNVKADVLAGMVVGIALIPEAIAFSIIAGLDPMVGLYASFCIAIVTAFAGGRPGLISAATGAMALVLAGLVHKHGVEYMLATTILTGLLQVLMGILRIGNLLRFIPRPVMIGFVNALAILIFKSQLTYFQDAGVSMYILVAVGIAIIYLFPKLNRTIPAPLIAILVLTAVTLFAHIDVTQIGDVGTISGALPLFALPTVPMTAETLRIIFPYAISLAIVGLTESMLTSRLIDELTNSSSNKNRECMGQGVANMVAGLFGGMAGCAMIGQSVINYKSGGRGRLSTLVAGVFLMLLILVFNPWVVQIPIAALVAVMIVVSVSTFDWTCLRRLRSVPIYDTIVMLTTVVIVLLTENLAYGVIVGIIISSLFFVHKISVTEVERIQDADGVLYRCYGQLFFASTTHFIENFDITSTETSIRMDVTHLKIWDESAVDALDKLLLQYSEQGVKVEIIGLSPSCTMLLEQISTQYPLLLR